MVVWEGMQNRGEDFVADPHSRMDTAAASCKDRAQLQDMLMVVREPGHPIHNPRVQTLLV